MLYQYHTFRMSVSLEPKRCRHCDRQYMFLLFFTRSYFPLPPIFFPLPHTFPFPPPPFGPVHPNSSTLHCSYNTYDY